MHGLCQGIRTGETGQKVFDAATIDDMCRSLDSDGDGTIDYEEFLAAALQTLKLEKDQKWNAGVTKAFTALDNDGNGYLTLDELQPMLGISSKETATMMREIDKDGDGKIDLEEFKQVKPQPTMPMQMLKEGSTADCSLPAAGLVQCPSLGCGLLSHSPC